MDNQLLIGGDFSGIQNYIYNIASKYASRNLKGRSNTLKTECEDMAKRVCDSVQGTIVVSSGGTFLLTADDNPENVSSLEKCIAREEQYVYDTYGTEIYVAIDYVHLNEKKTFFDATSDLFLKRDGKKNRRLSSLIKKNYTDFFEPQQWYYDKTDAVTGAYFKSEKDVRICNNIGAVTEQTLKQIELGEELSRKGGRINNFNRLVMPEKDADLTRIGVLRMDVDNLGTTFQNEIKKCTNDLTEYHQLSNHFTSFFSEENLYKLDPEETIYLVYSGGDDLFAVGRWDNTIAFAEKVHNSFASQSFVKERELSISGGVAILPQKYPIMKGATEGGELEDLAKDHSVGSSEKNSIAFLDMALNWEKEYPVLKTLKEKLTAMDEVLGSSFRSKILQHYANAEVKAHKITRYKTYWMIAYDLGRMKQRHSKNLEVVNLIDNCINEICENRKELDGVNIESSYHAIELWAFACRWAELQLRTQKQ